MKILQINVDRCRDAHDLLYHLATENNIDVCLVAEPNSNITRDWGGHQDAKIWTANQSMFIRASGLGRGFSWIETANYRIVSCYCSPNSTMDELEAVLDDISKFLRESEKKETIIGGDLNAKSPLWGAPRTDARGSLVAEWISSENLSILNTGGCPTFRRREQESWIDITLCTESLAARTDWKVLDEIETRSYHQYISIDIRDREMRPRLSDIGLSGWNTRSLDKEVLITHILERKRDTGISTAEDLIEIVTEACDKAMKRNHPKKKRGVYWWNEEIREKRKNCISARRKFTRERKRGAGDERCTNLYEAYKSHRLELVTEIKASKDRCWKQICEELEQDIWGRAYQIVTKKMGRKKTELPPELRKRIIDDLFPEHEIRTISERPIANDEIREFDMGELLSALVNIKLKKSPGPDMIPPLVVKEVGLAIPEVILTITNNLLLEGKVPKMWKEAKVALVPKPIKNQGDPATYRPLCLLNTFGKLYERMILNRLLKEVEEKEILAPQQYGFLPGKSTIQAIQQVVRIAETEINATRRKRKLCILIALDIKNAFNSAPWLQIIRALEKKGLSTYLIKLFEDYLKDRQIVGEEFQKNMTAGIPQGSLCSPSLWNILYDDVLRLAVPDGVHLIAYADDLAVVITGHTETQIEDKAKVTLQKISRWMNNTNLQIAPEKTEVVILSGRKKCRPLNIQVMGKTITVKSEVKYLGVVLDKNLRFNHHLKQVTAKADRLTSNLVKIMPRAGGAGENKRRVLNTVMESIILYAAPVWTRCLKFDKYRNMLLKEQRKMTLRICRAYRTTSTAALAVLGRCIPLDLLAEERSICFGKSNREKQNERQNTLKSWQERWQSSEQGAWTRRLIPDIEPWYLRKHGQIDYYLTQVLAGHGCFRSYLHRFKKIDSPSCVFCEGEEDTAYHTVFECMRWDQSREELEVQLTERLTVDNMVKIMLETEEKWKIVTRYLTKIMKEKIEIERRTQREETGGENS